MKATQVAPPKLDDMFEMLAKATKPLDGNMMVGLKSIYLEKPIFVRNGMSLENKRRILVGDMVGVENLELCGENEFNSHTILELMGNLFDTKHEIKVQCNNTSEIKTIRL